MRGLLKLGVAVFLVLSCLVVVDLVIERLGERRAEDRVAAEIGTPVEVDLQGWPVGLRLLTGRVPQAEITAQDVPLRGQIEVDHLEVVLADVRLGLRDLRSPPDAVPPARSGHFEAHIGGDATYRLAAVPASVASLRIEDGAVRLQLLGLEAAGDVRVRDGRVLIVPRTPVGALLASEIPLDLSDQPGRPRIREAEIDGDTLVIRGTLEAVGDDNEAADRR